MKTIRDRFKEAYRLFRITPPIGGVVKNWQWAWWKEGTPEEAASCAFYHRGTRDKLHILGKSPWTRIESVREAIRRDESYAN